MQVNAQINAEKERLEKINEAIERLSKRSPTSKIRLI